MVVIVPLIKKFPRWIGHTTTALLAAVFAAASSPSACDAQRRLEIELKPDLVLGEASGISFGEQLWLAVSSKGTIYVGDAQTADVVAFSKAGRVLDTIGRRGQGPGEFTAVHSLVVGRGDSLYVFDANLMRLAVYGVSGVSHALAYTVRPQPGEYGRPYRAMVPNSSSAGFLFAFRQPASGTISVHRVDRQGTVSTRAILVGAASESSVRGNQTGGSIEVVRTSPLFGRFPVLGITSGDEIYYAWTEAIDLRFYDLSGRHERTFKADSRPLPVTSRDIEFALADASEPRRRALAGVQHAQTKPAFHTVIIDDSFRIWTGRYTRDPERHEWWVTLDDGRGESAIVTLPSNVELQVVRGEYAYGVSVDAAGAPTVLRYRVTIR